MKLGPPQFLVITLFLGALAVQSQDVGKPKLVTEFGLLPCGHVHAITDAFAEEIKGDIAAQAAIRIYSPKVHPEQAERQRRRISSFLQLRGLDTDRFSFYKGGASPDGLIRTEFWKLEPGASVPFTDATPVAEDELDISRSFVFGYEDEINICPTFVPRAFAKLILDNKGSRGHIVVQVGKNGMIDRFWFAEQLIKELVESHGVPRERLRLFFAKSRASTTGAEFWFVPKRKK